MKFGFAGLLVAISIFLSGCDQLTSSETRIERATAQIAAGDFRSAVFELREVLEDEPAHAGARLMLAEAEFGSGDLSSAETDLDRAIQTGADPRDAAVLKSKLQLAFGRFQVLLTQLDAGELSLPEAQAQLYRGRALLGLNRPAEAMPAFDAALRSAPDLAEAQVGRAEAKAALGDVSGALADLARMTNSDPTIAVAWLARGGLLLQLGRPVDADEAMSKALEYAKGRLDEAMQVKAIAGQIEARLAVNQMDGAQAALDGLQKRSPNAPITRLLKARVELARDELPAAIAGLTALTNDLPDFVPARYLLGSALLAQGNLYQAERHLSAVVQAVPDYLEARKRLAEVRLRMDRPESAIELLGSSLEGGISDPHAVALLGAAQLSAGADPTAIPRLEEAVARQPENRAARLDLAGLYISAGDAAKAVQLLQATPASKDDARREFLLIRALATIQGEASARVEIERMVRDYPADTERLNLAAGFLLSFGDVAGATRTLEKALAARSDDVNTLVNLGRARLAAGRLDDAEALLRRALSHQAESVDARIVLAEIAGRRGKNDEARRLLEEIRIDDSRAVTSRLLLARLHLGNNETAKASKVLAEALAAAPNRSDVLVAAGSLQQDFGHHEQALGYFRKAADLEPQQPEHWIHVARSQASQGYQSAARESIERALKLNPLHVNGVALSVMLDFIADDKEAGLARAVELRRQLPRDAGAAMLEGDTRASLGQHAQAAAAYAEAARLQPSLTATVRLAQSRQLAGRPDAMTPLRDWLRARPDDLPARAMLAIFLDQAGQSDQAIREYERVLAGGQPDAVMSNNLALLYQKKGDSRAESLARQAYRLAPTNAAIADTLGWILHSKGAGDEGVRLLREAATLAPQEPEIQLHLAEALLSVGHKIEARDILAKIVEGGKAFAGRSRAQDLLRRAGG